MDIKTFYILYLESCSLILTRLRGPTHNIIQLQTLLVIYCCFTNYSKLSDLKPSPFCFSKFCGSAWFLVLGAREVGWLGWMSPPCHGNFHPWKGQIGILHMQSLGTHCCSKRRVNAVLCAEAKPLKLNNGTFSHSTGKGSHKTTHIQEVE